MNQKPLSVYMTEEEKEELKEYSEKLDRSVSWIIRRLCHLELTRRTLMTQKGSDL